MREESAALRPQRQGDERTTGTWSGRRSCGAYQRRRAWPARFRAGSRPPVQRSLGYRPTSGDDAIQDDDDGEDQEQVDQPTADIESEKAQQPEYEQDYRECPDHRWPP